MLNYTLIVVCILAGYILRKTNKIHPDAHKGINGWLLNIAIPAVSFKYIPQIEWSHKMILPAIFPIIMFFVAFACVKWYYHNKKADKGEVATMILATGFSNTSFIGFPLVVAYFGEKYLPIHIVCDQMSFIMLSSLGILTAVKGSKLGGSISIQQVVKQLITFPPLIGCIVALICSFWVPTTIIQEVQPFFGALSSTVAPLALFSVGLQLNFKGVKKYFKRINFALLIKLIVAPISILIVALLLKNTGTIAELTIFEAALPSIIMASMIAEKYGLEVDLINIIIGISILIGFATTAAWYFGLAGFFTYLI